MRKLERDVVVLDVACLTNDRGGDEQRAMLDLALEVDKARGAFMAHNTDLAPPVMVAHVEATYEPSTGRPVSLTAQQRKQYDALRARWEVCADCGWPQGLHYGNDDPTLNCPKPGDYYLTVMSAQLRAWREAHVVSVPS